MKFSVSRNRLLKSLNYCQGVIEKKSTLPILSNVLIEAKNSSVKITATDLDLISTNLTNNIKIYTEGSTTTSASVIYDIVRKLPPGSEINFDLVKDIDKNIYFISNIKYNLDDKSQKNNKIVSELKTYQINNIQQLTQIIKKNFNKIN